MRKKLITLQQADNDDTRYIVDRLVNCIEPTLGSVLATRDVERLITRHDCTVTIKRAKT